MMAIRPTSPLLRSLFVNLFDQLANFAFEVVLLDRGADDEPVFSLSLLGRVNLAIQSVPDRVVIQCPRKTLQGNDVSVKSGRAESNPFQERPGWDYWTLGPGRERRL
jgi:hypothetical protein